MIPIVEENGHYTVTIAADRQVVGAEQVGEIENQIRRRGYYPLHVTPGRLLELDEDADVRKATFHPSMPDVLARGMNKAGEELRASPAPLFAFPPHHHDLF